MQDNIGANSPKPSRNLWSKANIVWLGFAAIAAFYLLTEHRAHLFGAVPFLLLLACPLLHLFMHRGHGASQGDGTQKPGGSAGHRH